MNGGENRGELHKGAILRFSMTDHNGRLVVAVWLAGIAGFLHGLGPSIPLLVDSPPGV